MTSSLAGVESGYRRLRNVLVAVYAAIACAAGGLSALYLWAEYRETLQVATTQAGALHRALEEHVLRTFTAIDIQLRNTGRELVESRALERPAGPADVEFLRREKPEGDFVRSLYTYDAHGRGHSTSLGADIRRLHARDFEHFREILESGADRLTIGRASGGAVTRRPSIPVARGLVGADGRFAGIIGTAIEPAYFQAFYRALNLDAGATLGLLRADGAVLARFPEVPGAPQEVSGTAAFREHIAVEPRGAAEVSASPFDGARRTVLFRHVPGWPLIVTLSLEHARVIAPWRRIAEAVTLIVAGALALLLALLVLALRQIRRRAAAEERFALAVRGSSDGIWDWNLVTGEDYLSPRWKAILGYRDDELPNVQATFFDRVHPEDRGALEDALRRHLEHGAPYQVELRMRDKAGGYRWVLARGEALRDAAGRAVRMVGSITDITTQRRAEERLRASEASLREAQQLAEIGSWELDLVSRRLSWSDEIYRIFEIDPAKFEASYDAFLNAIHPDDRERVNRAYSESVAQGTAYGLVHRLRLSDGRIKYVQERGQTYYGEDGKPLRSVGTVQDITERALVEEALRITQTAVDSSINAIATGALDGTISYANRAFLDLWRLERPDQVLGHSPAEFIPDAPKIIEVLQRDGRWQGETTGVLGDGTVMDVQISAHLVRDASGRPLCLMASFLDVTERKRTEEAIRRLNEDLESRVENRTAELRTANARLQQSLDELTRARDYLVQSEKLAALGGLVAGVAHEVNTPVGIGVTAASLLRMKVEDFGRAYRAGRLAPEDIERFLPIAAEASDMVLANLKRAAELIRSFKQVAVDQSSGERRLFRLKNTLDDALVSLGPRLHRTRHDVRLDCPEDLQLYGHPGAYSQILANLIINSLVHGFEGIDAGRIDIEVRHDARSLVLRYTDNGRGIAAEHLPRLFEPFFTTKRGRGGSGLGLHVVYNLVTQTLQGTIGCTSEPGRGARFEVRVPYELPAEPGPPDAAAGAHAPRGG